ncbi:hypothetical protein ACIQXV_16050 [Neobacillus sp. NPDC097160]|uniref:hypothetical protein n=1 Tax=Neobacillus sp. NPDC097160 TaxID=3364298 RepID=UPI00380270BD
MEPIDFKEKQVTTALFQFIFPFSLKIDTTHNLFRYLHEQNFTFYQLNDKQKETAYYGRYQVSHRKMKSFFLPFTNNFLFPPSQQQKGFQRFTKQLDINGLLKAKHGITPFQIHSLDLFICPYNLGFITIRTEISNMPFSQAIEFADCFRMLGQQTPAPRIEYGGEAYLHVKDFLYDCLFPGLPGFFDHTSTSFLDTKKMYVQSLLTLNEGETIDRVDVYRSGTLCGINDAGNPYVNANNLDYISNYLKDHSWNRWAPTTYSIFSEECFSCMTNEHHDEFRLLAQQFYGQFYYAVLLNLFHKHVLLKIAADYSALNLDQDKKEIDHLIYTINSFTSNYFFSVNPVQTEGQELFTHIRKSFVIDNLYTNTKDILFSLFKYEENTGKKRDTLLLLVLTLYTVICGIFSMNLFTHDLEGKIHWSHFKSYNPFEYFAVFIVFSGIIVVIFLWIQSLYQAIQDRKKRKKWVQESVLSEKKP